MKTSVKKLIREEILKELRVVDLKSLFDKDKKKDRIKATEFAKMLASSYKQNPENFVKIEKGDYKYTRSSDEVVFKIKSIDGQEDIVVLKSIVPFPYLPPEVSTYINSDLQHYYTLFYSLERVFNYINKRVNGK